MIKINDKVIIKSRKFFDEFYGEHLSDDSDPLFPYYDKTATVIAISKDQNNFTYYDLGLKNNSGQIIYFVASMLLEE